MTPETRYAKSGNVHIAYQVVGDGPIDLVLVPGFTSHVEDWWEDPNSARYFQRLASFSRLILFDKRGTGMSDRVPDTALPTLSWLNRQSDAGDEFGICPITITEFYAGLSPEQYLPWDAFFAALTFCPISYDASIQAGQWRSSFRARGIQLSTTDTLVAAAAADAGAIVVTSNVKHYPMPVRLLDPRTRPASPGSTHDAGRSPR
jgi:predicted nucleic acid-binding protein